MSIHFWRPLFLLEVWQTRPWGLTKRPVHAVWRVIGVCMLVIVLYRNSEYNVYYAISERSINKQLFCFLYDKISL